MLFRVFRFSEASFNVLISSLPIILKLRRHLGSETYGRLQFGNGNFVIMNKRGNLAPKLRTGFVRIFGSRIEDFYQTFFQNNNFLLQTQGYQIGDQYRP